MSPLAPRHAEVADISLGDPPDHPDPCVYDYRG